MDLLPRIREILDAKPTDAQMDAFLSDCRESLATSNKQFIGLSVMAITALLGYHLVVYEQAATISLNSIQLSNTYLFHRVFLVVPAALLCATASIGYLRRMQRETYDYFAISRFRILGKVGLHELRLPSDHILGLFLLRIEGGRLGKVVAFIAVSLSMTVFALAPVAYVVNASVENIQLFGSSDFLALAASSIAITLCACSLLIIWLASRIKA